MNVAATDTRTIPEVRLDDLAATGIAPLEKAGCLVITGVTGAAERERLRGELASRMDRAPVWEGDNPKAFFPGYTRRIASMVARSETAREWIMHPLARTLCDRFLLPNCDDRYQLHVTGAIEIGPGARKQVLHREEDSFHFFPLPRPNLVLATMWSVTDFTAENGATLLVPGSHRWPRERRATPDEGVCAEMEAGSVLIWLGGTLHAGGANVSDDWRYGVILTYSAGWLRQEENQSLAVPRELAHELPKDLLDMIGHTMNGSLGFSEEYTGAVAAPDRSDGAAIIEMNE